MQYVHWDFQRNNFHSITVRVRIHSEPSLRDGLYFQMYQGKINGTGFYFGIQTDVNRPGFGSTGKGLIFSRWGTRDLSNVRTKRGWSEGAGYEGDFVGIRKNYEWTTHNYELRIRCNAHDDVGDWYGVGIDDMDDRTGDFVGSIRFPKMQSERAGIHNGGITWTELYYKKTNETPLPTWHVSVIDIFADEGIRPVHATSKYSRIGHTDIFYDKTTGEIHLVMGSTVTRRHPAGRLF